MDFGWGWFRWFEGGELMVDSRPDGRYGGALMKIPCLIPTLILGHLLVLGGAAAERPNIVMVITDDQGYGDLGHTGNPVIQTPEIDRLAAESTGLSDYHVAPTCSPTRASLLTGHWTNRTGVWHTVNGRSMLRENEVTIGEMLEGAGYATGMFGKWHLGDNYPYRPEDRGFSEVYRHGGGGVGQTPDVWDNAYFDGSYFHNGRIVAAKGFCTDVFFGEANRFIRECASKKLPFFAYISLNAPHGPLHAPRKYMDPYKDQPDRIAAFFGMITNIDENVGKTRGLLKELGIEENTVFIFTTDNGTATGEKVFNAGMRGRKGSPYDGGHRVPFFVHWPAGKMTEERDVDTLAHAVDVVPTLLEFAGVEKPAGVSFDGVSLVGLMRADGEVDWPERFLVTDSQRVRDPIKWRQSSVMSEQYRLVNGKELYDIGADPGQKKNIAGEHPGQVAEMRRFYDRWWAELEPTFAQTTEIHLGHPEHPEVVLTSHDWIQEVNPPWNQNQVRRGVEIKGDDGRLEHTGHWAVKVVESGRYRLALRRWPRESGKAINAALPAGENVPGASVAYRAVPGKGIKATKASLRIDGKEIGTLAVEEGQQEVVFEAEISAGSHQLAPVFGVKGGEMGAYYVTVTRL